MDLQKIIVTKIKQDNFITFDKYMDICLYYPDKGYYNNKNISLDSEKSDFITGPELSSIYTRSIINFYEKCKKYKKIDYVIEYGGGSGELAFNFLNYAEEEYLPKKYYIIEKSNFLKKQQQQKIKKLLKKRKELIEWVDNIPDINNVFLIANEVFDAIPSKIFIKKNNNFFEKVIKYKDEKLYFSIINCNENIKIHISEIEEKIGKKFSNNYSFEINFLYEIFLSNIFNKIKNFIFIIADYGYCEKEYYHADRSMGTIQYYKNHRKIYNPLVSQGSFDISVSVNFSKINNISKDHKVKLLTYTTQSEFLINSNILNYAQDLKDKINKNQILKTLLFPTEMGENFKIMILCDNINKKFKVSFKDYRHRL